MYPEWSFARADSTGASVVMVGASVPPDAARGAKYEDGNLDVETRFQVLFQVRQQAAAEVGCGGRTPDGRLGVLTSARKPGGNDGFWEMHFWLFEHGGLR